VSARTILLLSLAIGCGTNAPTYAACDYAEDCPAPSDGCYRLLFTRSDGTEADGNLCTLSCASDDDCPDDGACLALDGDPAETFFCAQRCVDSMECFSGFRCTTIEGAPAAMQVCLP
jgi:hypothetical protein